MIRVRALVLCVRRINGRILAKGQAYSAYAELLLVFRRSRPDILYTQNIEVRAMLKRNQTDVLLHNTAAVGALIRSRRKELALTQKQLSELTGLSLAFVNGIENGKETAEIGKALQLLAALGIDLQGRVR